MRLTVLAAVLFAFWLLLSGHFEPLLLFFGVVSTAVAVWLAWRMRLPDEEGFPIRLGAGALTYWPWLVVEIAKSTIQVTRIILDPRLPISPTMVRLKASQKTAAGITTYANSITLTPGTIAVEVSGSEREILVHSITSEFAESLEEGSFDRRVSRFEGQA